MQKHLILKFLDRALFFYTRIFGFVHDYRTAIRIKYVLNKVFTYSNQRHFCKFGADASISRSCTFMNPQYISIGDASSVGERTVITAWDNYENLKYEPRIAIGSNVRIGADCHLSAIQRISIGNGVLFGKKVTVTDNSHGGIALDQLAIPPSKKRLISKGPVAIEENVWIGDKATILPGVRIGKGAVIAANAVVTHDVPEGCIAAGVPAKLVRSMLVPSAD